MNMNISYVLTKEGVLATVTDDDEKHLWPGGHFLNQEELDLLNTNPSVLDAKIRLHVETLLAKAEPQEPPAEDSPKEPVEVRTAVVSSAEEAQATLDAYNAARAQVDAGLQEVIQKAASLPVEKRLEILNNVKGAVEQELKP